jgi:hypothetical protein
MPKPAAYITYRDLFDRAPSKSELDTVITSINAYHTALLTARMSAMFRHAVWSQHPQDTKAMERFQYWFAAGFLDLETKQRLEARFGPQNPARRPVFHPLQFLNVMRLALAIAEGDESTRPDVSEPHRFQLGTACLMASDLLVTDEELESLKKGSTDERRRHLMLQWLAPFEISFPTPIRNLFARAYATYKIVLRDASLLERIRQECEGLDLEKEFETNFGITLMAWLSLVFAVQTALTMHTQETLINEPEKVFINRKSLLQNSTLSQSQIDDFFNRLSTTFDELRLEIRKERPVDERLDLVPFKSKPFFVAAPDVYACSDYGLITEKLHTGPYFLLSNQLPEAKRPKVFKAWGLIFEHYVNWLLRGLDGRHSARLYPDTCWEDGKKSFDAVFVKSRVVAVMEHKGGFLRQDARYSNDLEKFTADLQSKIGVGCMQLARDIGAAFPANGKSKGLHNVPIPSNTLFVLPVLVVQDLMLRCPFINYFMNQLFQSERTRFPTRASVQVLPLNLVQITDLEDLVEMAEAFDLDVFNFFHRRCNENREMLLELPDAMRSIYDPDRNRPSPRREDIIHQFNDEMCSILFKDFKPRDPQMQNT